MLLEVFAGETVRLSANHLTHSDEGSVTAGATVTITLLNPDGTTADEQTATTGGSGDDWFADFTAPATPGEYAVKMVAVVSGATWKGKNMIRVAAF